MEAPERKDAQLEVDSCWNVEPVKLLPHCVRYLARSWKLQNDPRCSPKNTRQTIKEKRRSATEEPVTVVESRDDECPDERMTGVHGKGVPNRS